MELFLKACGAVLLTVILILAQGSISKDLSMVLSVAVCSMMALTAMEFLQPVIGFIAELEQIGGIDHTLVSSLLKVTGIGLVSEVAAQVCADAGNGSLGKAIKLLGSAVILWLSIPMFTMLIDLLQRILGEV